jgi:predicted transcriptional regulator
LQLAAIRRFGEARSPPNLRDVRHLYALSQVALAKTMGVDQGFVSRIEQRDDLKLSLLERYVTAMGGHLEVTVRFPDYTAAIAIRGARDAPQ